MIDSILIGLVAMVFIAVCITLAVFFDRFGE